MIHSSSEAHEGIHLLPVVFVSPAACWRLSLIPSSAPFSAYKSATNALTRPTPRTPRGRDVPLRNQGADRSFTTIGTRTFSLPLIRVFAVARSSPPLRTLMVQAPGHSPPRSNSSKLE